MHGPVPVPSPGRVTRDTRTLSKLVVIALLAWNTLRSAPTLKVACALWTTVGVYVTVIANNLLTITAMR